MPLAPVSRTETLGAVTLSSGTASIYYPGRPVRILSCFAVVHVAVTGSDTTVTLDQENLTGGVVSPVGTEVGGTMTFTTANAGTVGAVVHKDLSGSNIVLYPGESLAFDPDGGATAGAARIYYEVEDLSMTDAAQRPAGSPGTTTNPTPLHAATKVTS